MLCHPSTLLLVPNLVHNLIWQHVRPDSKHLGGDARREPVDLFRVLLDLSRVEQSFESAWLLRELEKSLPLVLWQRRLLGDGALCVLCFPLLLPLGDLCLLAGQRSLIELVVVQFGMVVLDAVKEEVAAFLEEWVDGKVEGFEIWCERRRSESRV